MTITPASLVLIKDLLLFTDADTEMDAIVAAEWEQQLAVLARTYDLFAYETVLDTDVGQSVYRLPVVSTRVYSVMFRGVTLGYTDAETLNLRDPDWELALPSTPQFWSFNAVPPHADVPDAAVTPQDLLITPAPDGAQAGPGTLRVFGQEIPDRPPAWVDPVLIYRVAAALAQENPNLAQPEKGEFFTQLAEQWLTMARRNLPM